MTSSPKFLSSERITPSVTTVCVGCGCLCDDVRVVINGPLAIAASGFCELGRDWLEGQDTSASSNVIQGPEALEEAYDRVARLLLSARRPLIWGLTYATTEAIRLAVELADRVRALVLLDTNDVTRESARSFQDLGRVRATLGEVKNRADLLIYWGSDPSRTHPRHIERYSANAPARFLPGGRPVRKLVVVGDPESATAAEADLDVPLAPGLDLSLLNALRLEQRGLSAIEHGIDPNQFSTLCTLIAGARYGALFYEPRATDRAELRCCWDAASGLVRSLSDHTRFVLMSLGNAGNSAGAEAVLGWQTGFSPAVDFRLGRPAPVEVVETLEELITEDEVDAIVVIAGRVPKVLANGTATLPLAVIGPPGQGRFDGNSVSIESAPFPLGERGTLVRSDGVPVVIRPRVASAAPRLEECLAGLLQAIERVRGGA